MIDGRSLFDWLQTYFVISGTETIDKRVDVDELAYL